MENLSNLSNWSNASCPAMAQSRIRINSASRNWGIPLRVLDDNLPTISTVASLCTLGAIQL